MMTSRSEEIEIKRSVFELVETVCEAMKAFIVEREKLGVVVEALDVVDAVSIILVNTAVKLDAEEPSRGVTYATSTFLGFLSDRCKDLGIDGVTIHQDYRPTGPAH